MMAVNMPQNNKKKVFTMQLASSVNIQLLGLAEESGKVATNGDVSVVRVSASATKKNVMPVLHEQPSEDGVKSMPLFRVQTPANGQKSMPIESKQQPLRGVKAMPVFRQQQASTNGVKSMPVFTASSSVDGRAPSPVVKPAQQRVSTSSTSSSEGGVTVVAVNFTGQRREVTKAVKVTSEPPFSVTNPAPPVVVPEPAPPVIVQKTAPPVVVPQPPPSPPPAPATPEPLSPPPPPPPPLPPAVGHTRIQLSRSVSLTRSSSNAAVSRSAIPAPPLPTDNSPNYRPLPSRIDPFSFSLMIKNGRRKLSNEAFRTSRFVKSSGSGSGSGSGSSSSNADKSPLPDLAERQSTDSANGASLPDSTTGPSLPDIDGSSDSVFSDKSTDTSSTSSIEVTLTGTPGKRGVRAVLVVRRDLTVMLKVSCKTEQVASDERVLALICRIATPCLEHFKREKVQQLDLTAPNIMKLSLDDAPVKEHVAALSRDLGEDIIVSEAMCRKSTKKQHIGTSMNDIVYKEGGCQVAKSGVIVMLTKKNKLAPIQEFVDQLCYHVHVSKPTSLGSSESVVLGRRPQRHERINKKELLSQAFTYDPIISVAEAAHRSFVEINNFALYE